jgi:CRISPR/Cas system CSM-associated protein Csm3 (group 7 of RAMP superfamily)
MSYTIPTRWCITGTLTTRTPLHIGAGTTTTHPDLKNEKDDKFIEIAAIVRDYQDQPYIPASTLKGNLRAWLKDRMTDTTQLDSVFGREVEQDQGLGGKAEFGNAFLTSPLLPTHPPAYWRQDQQTGIEVGVTIDRVTRTAQEQRLFHHEFVPPDVSFTVRITGKGLEDTEMALLLAGLEGFNHTDQPIRLGGDNAQDKGCFTWQLQTITQLDQQAVKEWLAQESPGMWYTALRPLLTEKQADLLKTGQNLLCGTANSPILELHLKLKFDSPFLVNEPYWKNLSKSEDVKKQIDVKCPDHQPRRDHLGKAVLPSQSLRGAIRAQAERIIRTLGGKACELTCDPIDKRGEVETTLCLACQLFGATGWQSPIHISDFTWPGEEKSLRQEFVAKEKSLRQEFVAIDRFTGGGCEGLKFNAAPVYRPTFEGVWKIDLRRVEPWGLGLLALLIRDMIEGDVTFGYGAAKGYGHCRATVVNKDKILEKMLNCCPVSHLGLDAEKTGNLLVNELVQDFRNLFV